MNRSQGEDWELYLDMCCEESRPDSEMSEHGGITWVDRCTEMPGVPGSDWAGASERVEGVDWSRP